MIDILKGLWKWILWILAIIIVGLIILAIRIFVIDKNFDGTAASVKSKNNDNSQVSYSKDNSKNSKNGYDVDNMIDSIGSGVKNGATLIKDSTVKGYKEDEENYTYNSNNFDEAFLMYEGEQYDGAVKNVLEHLIDNSEDDFYARTSVTARNFGNNVKIDYNGDVIEYQNAIKSLENSVSEGIYYISFGYGALHSYVNEIIITKK